MKQPELSIIIPVKNAHQYLLRCMKSLQKIEDVVYEVIIVDDASNDLNVIEYLKTLPSINVLHSQYNLGFIQSCKIGAEDAIGKYLLFLNSDTELIDSRSFRYMLDVFQTKQNIGVVGARLLYNNNTIQHAGLSFDRSKMNYMHRFIGVDRDDIRVTVSGCVEAITGACFMVSKKLWFELNGFDICYSPGYFEDSDYCLRAKQKGYQSYYCAEAVLKHYQSKSFGGGPSKELYEKNFEIFKQRWVRTSKLCEYPKIVACYIVFNEAEYISYSIKSIYKMVDKIVIVEGAAEQVQEFANKDGSSTDGTIKIIKNIPDPENKINLVQGKWKDKTEQRNAYCKFTDGMDYMWVIDGDEVWDKETLQKIEHLIFARPDVPAFQFNFHDFWQDFNNKLKGPWEQYTGRKSLIHLNITGDIKYNIHTLPVTLDDRDIPAVNLNDIYFYHYSYLRSDEKMKQKISYYFNQDSTKNKIRKNWFEEIWLKWKEDKSLVEKTYGTHPFGGGWTEEWLYPHPEIMKNHPYFKKYLENKGLQLFLTSTPQKLEGFKNYNHTNHDLLDIPDNIYLILAENVIEQYSYKEILGLIIDWYNKLVFGGLIIIRTPNLQQICKEYLENKVNFQDTVIKLYARQEFDKDFHACLYDDNSLKFLLEQAGFTQIKIEKEENNLILKASGFKKANLF